jgi:uncharacterized membrane protein YcaP (DUF421 family)
MFFDDWHALLRILIVGPCGYLALVAMLRVSGKRTLSKFNAFDLVITVALGSTFATAVLSKSVPLAEGLVALATLIALQFAITWLSVRYPPVGRLIKSEPRLLYHRDEFLRDAMKAERITEGELLGAVREAGVAMMADVSAVIIETAGTMTVVPKSSNKDMNDEERLLLRSARGVSGDAG